MSVDFYKEFGELGYLANYSNHGFYEDGVFYKTVEHYYQAKKYDNPTIIKKILDADTPKEASTIGRDRSNIRIPNFKNIKDDVMFQGIYLKFMAHPDIRAKLIETGNRMIREMTINEFYWGVGYDLSGENHIGKILCDVREKIKSDMIDNLIKENQGKRVYVIGHNNPDCDSFFSAILLSRILKNYGVDAVSCVRDKNFIDKDIVNDINKDDYQVINDFDDKKFILVDHNNLLGIPKENVIFSIDHHRITGNVLNLIEIEYASCGLLIYDLFKEKYQFNVLEKMYIIMTVLTDTDYLTSSRFSCYDKELFNEVNYCNIDISGLKKKYFKTTDFNNNIIDNLINNSKEYNFNDKVIRRSLITGYGDDYDMYYDKYVSSMRDAHIDLLIFCDYENMKTYFNFNGENKTMPKFTSSTNLVLNYINNLLEYLKTSYIKI